MLTVLLYLYSSLIAVITVELVCVSRPLVTVITAIVDFVVVLAFAVVFMILDLIIIIFAIIIVIIFFIIMINLVYKCSLGDLRDSNALSADKS